MAESPELIISGVTPAACSRSTPMVLIVRALKHSAWSSESGNSSSAVMASFMAST